MCGWLALAAPWAATRAQSPAPVLGRYQLDVWRAQDGVRLAFTSNLVQTHDGYLWLSTQSGLTRFDGTRFAVFDGASTPALRGRPGLQTYPLVEDGEHVLWIGSDVGLLTYRGGTFAAAPNARFDAAVATDLVNAAVLAPDGRVWAVTRLGRLFQVSRTAGLRAVPGPRTRALGSTLAVDAGGDVWITAGPQGVLRAHHDAARGDVVSAVTFPAAPPMDEVTRIVATPDGALWFGTATAVVEWKDGRLRRVPLPARSALGAVSCLAVGADGALWIGTEGAGLYRYDGRTFAHVSRADGLSDDRIIDLLVDRSGNLWVATRDGLNRFRPRPFRVLTTEAGLPTELPGAIVRDRAGAVWMAPPTGGLFHGRVTAGRAHFTQAEAVGRADRVTALTVGRSGAVWAGRRGGSVSRFVDGEAARPPAATGLPPVTDVLEDADGTLWIGTWHGLFRVRPGEQRAFGAADGLPDDAIHRLLRDGRGTLWVATQRGVARADLGADRFTGVPLPERGATRATVLFEAPAGTVWAASADGLARVAGGRPTLITAAHGLPESWVGAGELDGAGNLWLGQLGGLTRVRLAELLAVADGRAAALATVAAYRTIDGLPGGDPTAWPHPWSFRDATGQLWFAMGHGIAVVDPTRVDPPARPPMPHVEDVLVDGAQAPSTRAVTLTPDASRIELRYSGVDLSDGPGVRFRYRLDGFDTAWTDAGPQRVASYTRLAAGRYRFRVTARAGQGGWNAAEAWTDVEVQSPVYRRPWFIAVVGAALTLTLWAVHRVVLRTRLTAVRAERSRMAREIHDSLLQGFGGIALQLHAASARLALPPAQQPLIDRVLRLIDETLTEARERVWDLRRADAGTSGLAADCEVAATRVLAGSGAAARVVCHGRTRRLSPAAHAESLHIVQEALTNVRKHAAATEVRITLDYRWRALRLTVRDDGRGSDAALLRRPVGHWGILGMQERAGRIGARLALQSRPGEGTEVALTVGYARGIWTRREPPAGDAAAAED